MKYRVIVDKYYIPCETDNFMVAKFAYDLFAKENDWVLLNEQIHTCHWVSRTATEGVMVGRDHK